MAVLAKKIDFIGFITVERSNPNGDPLNGNQPRTDYGGYGEISDVCLKRKLRNRLQDAGEKILVQSNELAEEACKAWIDVRAFGQVFALKEAKKQGVDSVSVGVRGPVTLHTAVSLDPVTITGVQITKSVNNEPGDKKGSDTMGMKYRVDFGVYKFQGSINVQLAEKTGFSEEDAAKIKEALRTIFENDASSARPEGSMEMNRFYWIEHGNKTGSAPSAKVHRSVLAQKKEGVETPARIEDYTIDDGALYAIDGIRIEKYVEGSLVN